MGMAASQARLLSITARLSDNEQAGQQLSYAKERLADRTDQVTKEYNEALSATKLQIMTGYADGAASYTDISFNMLTSPQVVSQLGKQYCVTDTKGRVLVSPDVAEAYQKAHGSLNAFLGALTEEQGGPYSISDVDPSKKVDSNPDPAIVSKIHEAWDKYFNSIGKSFMAKTEFKEYDASSGTFVDKGSSTDVSHDWTFEFVETGNKIGEGYVTISYPTAYKSETDSDGNTQVIPSGNPVTELICYEGTNQEQLDLYNYAMAITESYYSKGSTITIENGEPPVTYDVHDYQGANVMYDQGNSSMISYYTNLYNKMLSSGYYSYTDTADTAMKDSEHWIYDAALGYGASSATTDGTPLQDPNTFETFLKDGKLLLETFSKSANKFVSISISADTCIQEVEDDTKIAAAEAKYEADLAQIQRLDSRYDLQMKQLDTEHNTLQTEYESVKNIITKNVESSFKTFG